MLERPYKAPVGSPWLDEKSGKRWIMAGLTQLRPRVGLELYVELELWKKYVETLPREAEPSP